MPDGEESPEQIAEDVGHPAADAGEARRRAEDDLGMTDAERRKVSGDVVDTGEEMVVPVQQTVGAEEGSGGGEFPEPGSERGEVAEGG